MFAPKNILVPTDFSEYSDKALKKAVDIASEHKSKIYLLHVVDQVVQCAVDYCLDISLVKQVEKQSLKFAREKLQKEVEQLAPSKKIQISADVKMGDTLETILKEQKDKRIDLIVIASRGKKGLIHHLGSVADKVMRAAKCPVMLVK
ncbi:MAG TPA: universal stress protein [Syntrophales bacterium]|nr:universal stress protein [Syntrophales bacterium]